MSEVSTTGGPGQAPDAGGSSTRLQLSMALELFGLRTDASATFGPGTDTVLAVRLGNLTVGELIRFLVDKAEPGLHFALPPQWDFLNTINLHAFTFEVDLTRSRIGFRYDDIGFRSSVINLSAVQVFYAAATADRPKSVDLALFGSFLGVDYTKDPGLTWDVLSQPAPTVPGQGAKVFDLEYLGLGQHVAPRNLEPLTTLGAVINALEGAHRPVTPGRNPLAQLPALTFDATAGWFFATKFSALETVTLSAVFDDPVLYGLRVALDGKRVGKLAGLQFEILYRKISDSLGVFHTELKLPDAVRTIEAGEATITLPIIDIDVYTNGDFLIDLGFPRNLDFSRALSVDFIVFVPVPIPVSAAVGLYFGVLSGATSRQVPQVTNGRFDPVVVAGIGVRLGLGYTVSLGPLRANFFAGVVGILEGVLAWFHPDADPDATAVYYRMSGTVGIQIHIVGTVDFAILSAAVDIEAHAYASAVVESHQPIHLTFEAGVTVALSVKVAFFRIKLSFHASVRESITIGSATPTPWVLGAPSTGGAAPPSAAFAEVLAAGISWHDRAELVADLGPRSLTAATETAETGLTVPLYLHPMLTAGLVSDRPGHQTTTETAPQLVAMLFTEETVFAQWALAAFTWAVGLAEQSLRAAAGDATDTPLAPDSWVTAEHLRALHADLTGPGAFPMARVRAFLDTRSVVFDLRPLPAKTPAETPDTDYTVFPMPPFLTMTVDGQVIDFATGPYTAGADYQSLLATYFRDLTAAADPTVPPSEPTSAAESVAAVLFADCFAFLLRQTVQDALDRYRSYPYTAKAGQTLDDIAAAFGIAGPPDGDPAARDAAVIAIGRANQNSTTFFRAETALAIEERVVRVGVGETLRTLADRVGVPPLVVATAVRDRDDVLPVGTELTITGGIVTIADRDTLTSIATRLGQADPRVVLAAVADVPRRLTPMFGLRLPAAAPAAPTDPSADPALYVIAPGETLSGIAERNDLTLDAVGRAADVAGLLVTGATFALPALRYRLVAPESLAAIADRFGTSLAEVVRAAEAQKLTEGLDVALGLSVPVRGGDTLRALAQRFALTPADVVRAIEDAPDVLTPGALLRVARAGTYVVEDGDGLASIAARFSTSEEAISVANPPADPRNPHPPLVGSRIALPPDLTYRVAASDTLAGLARRYSLSSVDLVVGQANPSPDPDGESAGAANLDSAELLTPTAIVRLPGVTCVTHGSDTTRVTAGSDTPLAIARRFGITVDQLVAANRAAGFGDVVVPDVARLPFGELVDDLDRDGAFTRPAGSLARFLLHGLRLPAPDDPAVTAAATTAADRAGLRLYPLSVLTGQQVNRPSDDTITLAASAGSHLVTFAGGDGPLPVTLSDADRTAFDAIAEQLHRPLPFDAATLAVTPYPPSVVVPRQYALGKPIPWQAPSPPRVTGDADDAGTPAVSRPALYPFPDALRTQVATTAGPEGLLIDLVTGVEAGPTAPADLQPVTGFCWATMIDFGVRRTPDLTRPGAFLPTVFEVFGTQASAVDDLALLLDHLQDSADTVSLTLLHPADAQPQAGAGLRSNDVAPAEVLLLKANLSTQSRPPVGARAAAIAAASTEKPDELLVAATADEAHAFLTLLWEAAVTNDGGYYLRYDGLPAEVFNQDPIATLTLLAVPRTVSGAPSTVALRAAHNTAVVVEPISDPTAAVLATPRRFPTSTDAPTTLGAVADAVDGLTVAALGAANIETRNLLVAGTTVTVTDGTAHTVAPGDTIGGVARAMGADVAAVVDAVATQPGALTAGAAVELYPGWLTHRGTLRPGAAGFRVVRTDPDPDGDGQDDDAGSRLAVLFNLIGYRLTGDQPSGFAASADGLPIGPTQATGGPLNHELTAVDGRDPWTYQKQMRVDRFARGESVVLGPDTRDPYAGVGTTAQFGWQYQDVFGNRLLPPDTVDVEVRYTDELIALSQWPALLQGYRFTGARTAEQDDVALTVPLELDTSVYTATPGEVFAQAGAPDGASPAGIAARATAHRDRYAEIFWQLSHDVVVEIATTVDNAVDHAVAHQAQVDTLTRFTQEVWGYLGTVAGLTQATVSVKDEDEDKDTLTTIAASCHVPVAELVAANRSVAQNAAAHELIEQGSVVFETRYRVNQNDTLAHIADQAGLDPASVAGLNPDLALQAGRLLTPGAEPLVAAGGPLADHATLVVPKAAAYQVQPGDTLASVAGRFDLDPAELGAVNAHVAGLVAPEQSVLLERREQSVGKEDTFASLAAAAGMSVAELAAANADNTRLLHKGALVALPRHVLLTGAQAHTHQITAGETPRGIADAHEVDVALVGAANADVDGVLAPGVALSFTPAGGTVFSAMTQSGDTLSTVAVRLQAALDEAGVTTRVTAGLIAEANADVACLKENGWMLVPPARAVLTVPVGPTNPAALFPLEVTVTVRRTEHVEPALADNPAVTGVSTPLAPFLPEGAGGRSVALRAFAETFETTFAGVPLKLATTGDRTGPARFVAVRLGGAVDVTADAAIRYFFAPRPLTARPDGDGGHVTALWSSPRPIPVSTYTRGAGLAEAAQLLAFSGVDLDVWGRQLLAALDLVLSADYAATVHRLDPSAYHDLVTAKNMLAGAIRDSVIQVTAPDTAQAADLAAAREALHQRLLTTLSTAYEVDAVVVVPVAVTALDCTDPIAPRLHGQPIGTAATVPTVGATLRKLADGLGAPLPLVVDTLADASGLLQPDAVVTLNTVATTVTSADTLATLAARLTVTGQQLGAALADTSGLLQPGATVDVVVRTSAVTQPDTLFDVLTRLAIDVVGPGALAAAVDNLAAMNATRRGLLTPGVAVAVGGSAPHTVGGDDTLETVANDLGARPSEVVTALLHASKVLVPGATVAYLSRVPGYTLSPAEIPLVRAESTPLAFLLDTASAAAFDSISLDVQFQVNQLEYAITDVPWASGYRSSHWLTFLVPPPPHPVGRIDVPIALREFPVPPSVTGQHVVPHAVQDTATTLQDLRRYDYSYTFDVTQAAQDVVIPGVTLNTPLDTSGVTALLDPEDSAGLGGSLARFATVRADLEQDLALVPAVDPLLPADVVVKANPGAVAAVHALAELATQIAADWVQWVKPSPTFSAAAAAETSGFDPGSAPAHDLRFTLRRGTSATGEPTAALLPRGPVAHRFADEVRVRDHAPVGGAGLAAPDDSAGTPQPAAGPVTVELRDRDLISTQNIWGRVSLTRNTNLLAGVETASAFVYTVPDARMPAPAVPRIVATDPIDLAAVPQATSAVDVAPTDRRTLVEWLVNFFDSLLNRVAVGPDDTLAKIAARHGIGLADLAPAVVDVDGLVPMGSSPALPGGGVPMDARTLGVDAGSPTITDVVVAAADTALAAGTLLRPVANTRYLRVGVDYAFVLATAPGPDPSAPQEILTRLPVLLRPAFLFDSTTDLATDHGFCADLARALTAWTRARGVPDDVGLWALDVSLYTTLPSANPDSTPPLLELHDVRLRRDRIAPTVEDGS